MIEHAPWNIPPTWTSSAKDLVDCGSGSSRMAYAQKSGCSKCCDALGGFADQDVVGRWSGAGADAEQGIEGGMACAAPIEAEHELVEVVLKVRLPQSMIDAQAPTFEV